VEVRPNFPVGRLGHAAGDFSGVAVLVEIAVEGAVEAAAEAAGITRQAVLKQKNANPDFA
jgi:hypothetical protein